MAGKPRLDLVSFVRGVAGIRSGLLLGVGSATPRLSVTWLGSGCALSALHLEDSTSTEGLDPARATWILDEEAEESESVF